MGWVSKLFGEKTEISFRDEQGRLVKKSVPKAEFPGVVLDGFPELRIAQLAAHHLQNPASLGVDRRVVR